MKMKSKMLKLGIAVLAMMLCCSQLSAQAKRKANKDTEGWRYELEGVGIGTQGSYLVRVWSYSKKKDVATEQCKKNAVHGIIFKGFTANAKVRTGQKPLAKDPALEVEHAQFFKDFFANNGKYMKFVTISTDAASEVVKVGKEYKVGVTVSVNVSELRKDLEAAGIIRGLSTGF